MSDGLVAGRQFPVKGGILYLNSGQLLGEELERMPMTFGLLLQHAAVVAAHGFHRMGEDCTQNSVGEGDTAMRAVLPCLKVSSMAGNCFETLAYLVERL